MHGWPDHNPVLLLFFILVLLDSKQYPSLCPYTIPTLFINSRATSTQPSTSNSPDGHVGDFNYNPATTSDPLSPTILHLDY
ncbi:hypothetical protein ACTXT7_014265 [Hymenolepis weldensis]